MNKDLRDVSPVLFFVYGTLKAGHGNHRVIQSPTTESLGEHVTEPNYTLLDGGYPAVIRNGETAIHGELYKVYDMNTINGVFGLEGVRPENKISGSPKNGFYDFDVIDTPHGEAVIFVMDEAKNHYWSNAIPSGIWR